MHRLAIIGSTGSIGRQTLEVVKAFSDRFEVKALAAGHNLELLARQVNQFKPAYIFYRSDVREVEVTTGIKHCRRLDLAEIVTHPDIDTVVFAISGTDSIIPLLAAIRAGKRIILSNKESLVAAGEIIMATAREQGVQILPVDSEHSAIWQCLWGEKKESILKIILTASGGAFRDRDVGSLTDVTPEEALKHPTWKMGSRVTIDSATLMNKGMEVIEARWLFDIPITRISVLIHPQSIVHSLVAFADGSIKAHLSLPDMRLPIQVALLYPDRMPGGLVRHLELEELSALTFYPPDKKKYPSLFLAIQAGERGGTYPAVMCAADEVAVNLFLNRTIRFTDIYRIVLETVESHQSVSNPTIDDILTSIDWAKDIASKLAFRDVR